MKILIFNWQDIRNPLSGGAEVHLHQIFSRVAAMGHRVTLFCSSFDGAPAEEMIDGVHVVREGGRGLFNYVVPRRYFTRFRHEGYDAVIDDMNKIPFYTPLYVREPLFVLIHHLFAGSIFRETSPPVAAYVYLAERMGVAAARIKRVPLMVVSPSTRSDMVRRGFREENISIIQNCVDHALHRPDPAARSGGPLVGYFGRLKRYKSVDHLLNAFAIVKRRIPNLRLVVIGEGDHRPALQSLARRLSIERSVRFTGYVDEGAKVRLLQEAWFMVNTSSKEGWGLTVIEANACGTPVLASNVPGLRDAIREDETGLFYRYGDVGELATKMEMMIKDVALRERLSRGAYRWSQTFDWQAVAELTVDILQKRIGG